MALQRTLILTSPMATGEDVKEAQRLLKRHGDYAGEISGEFDILSVHGSRSFRVVERHNIYNRRFRPNRESPFDTGTGTDRLTLIGWRQQETPSGTTFVRDAGRSGQRMSGWLRVLGDV